MTTSAVRSVSQRESPRRRFLRRFLSQRGAVVMAAVILVLLVVALLAPWIMPQDPNTQDLSNTLAGPSAAHPLGTDELGRDVLSRMIAATRVTMIAGIGATIIGVVLGVPLGLLAGFLRGPLDAVLSRVVDALMAIPTLLLVMAIVAMSGVGLEKTVIAIGIASAPRFFRVARGVALVTREETFVEAARSLGRSDWEIAWRHVLPNISSPLIVQTSLTVGFSVLFEASLSFLGLGVQPPETSWGMMLRNSSQYAYGNALIVLLPGAAILVVVLAFNVVGDAIRDSVGREVRVIR